MSKKNSHFRRNEDDYSDHKTKVLKKRNTKRRYNQTYEDYFDDFETFSYANDPKIYRAIMEYDQ